MTRTPASARSRRTYNISRQSIETVKRLVEEHGVAPTQDALVEQAIAELARRIRDQNEAVLWGEAAADPDFGAEIREIEAGFAEDDIRAW